MFSVRIGKGVRNTNFGIYDDGSIDGSSEP